MKIIQNPNLNINFSARNKNIRKADDIMRKAKCAFPVISSTYVDTFYKTVSNNNQNSARREKTIRISDKINDFIHKLRDTTDRVDYFDNAIGNNIPYSNTLRVTSLYKLGNCEEAAAVALSALIANGYTNSHRANLGLQVDFENKKTGKIEDSRKELLDHTFVVTTLDKKNPKMKDIIVVDPWMGFTDSVSGAISKFKSVYDNNENSNTINTAKSMFKAEQEKKYGKIINFNDYNIRTKLIIFPRDKHDKKFNNKLAEHIKEFYPEIILDE
ncbi:hypothetical protein IJ182_09640 [bacterium]|nr:hypothetical protein [bacterium]